MPTASIDEPSSTAVQGFARTTLLGVIRRAKHRPVLIFQGGSYDGCVWEWNALFFQPGAPHRLEDAQPGVSGRAGARVLRAARRGLRPAVLVATAEGDWHLCTTQASWETFDRTFNKGFVRRVCKVAGRECRCDGCQRWFDPEEIVHTGYRGNGGVGVQFDDNYCLECANEQYESYCAEQIWKCESIEDRVRAIQEHNEESTYAISVFAARRDTAPVGYRFYAGEPEYY